MAFSYCGATGLEITSRTELMEIKGSGRYDVVFPSHGGPHIEPHFCRVWEEGVGCYGTNASHGFTFEEAKGYIVEWWQEVLEETTFPEEPDDDVWEDE